MEPRKKMDGSNIRAAKLQKERELMALQQMSYSVEQLKNRLNVMVENFEDIAGGTEEVSLVLSNWNDIKRQISLATLSLANYYKENEENQDPASFLTEGAVRVPITSLRDDNDGDSEYDETGKKVLVEQEAKQDLEDFTEIPNTLHEQ